MSLRVRTRVVLVNAVLVTLVAGVGVATLLTGDFPVTPGEVLDSLLGHGAPGVDFIVRTLRLPRLLTGLLVGAALAVSGSIFQSVTRNPLGSPDIIGFTAGSATGAVVAVIVLNAGAVETQLGALAGGVTTGAAVYLLSYRRGLAGPRLVLIGIGFTAMLTSVNSYLITRAQLAEAIAAQLWLIGSLNGRGWEQVRPLAAVTAVTIPLALCCSRRLALLEMGDDTAAALGVAVERGRLALVALGTVLAACATAVAGPVAFVALAVPPLARRLAGSPRPALLTSALLGALLVAASDLAAQRVFAPTQLPVGVGTSAIGGLYLVSLLLRRRRDG
ncbi:iron chelate uptake ABC transporter family permease subunit [Frankia sp. CN6]|uniref:Iron chelate uptake ABC transporter family permease subunit n=1 Tax=Frankia nepalensis TaxID=1836974 RepID=A0A937RH42_9ACTN|nr:iron chelate uptake ABC transporter family permease subunit [Frankia nepalensis]